MKNIPYKIVSLIAIAIGFSIHTQAQTSFKQSGYSYVTVAGTSTLHSWTMTSLEVSIQGAFELSPTGSLTQIKSLSVTVPSESLKSEHKAMDKNAYASLKTDKNKSISFTLSSSTAQKNIYSCVGNLSIAGVTKVVSLDATCEVKANKSIGCTGQKVMKMKDFEVDPPSFMFGTVKTGDEITVSFNVELTPIKN